MRRFVKHSEDSGDIQTNRSYAVTARRIDHLWGGCVGGDDGERYQERERMGGYLVGSLVIKGEQLGLYYRTNYRAVCTIKIHCGCWVQRTCHLLTLGGGAESPRMRLGFVVYNGL